MDKLSSNTAGTTTTRGLCAIDLHDDEAIFAYIQYEQGTPILKSYDICPFDKIEHLEDCIAKMVNAFGLTGVKCNLILHPHYYKLLLVNKPEVDPSEYKAALRWQIKDMVDYALEDVSIDIFAPAGLTESEAKKIYAVAAQNSFLEKIVSIIANAGLQPISIDIREFAIRNIVSLAIPDNQPIIFLHINHANCLLMIIKHYSVHFARRIAMGFDTLKNQAGADELLLEIHRSLDYYNTELKQSIPEKIVFAPTTLKRQELLSNLITAFGKDHMFLDVNSVIKCDSSLSLEQQARCYVAIGGALRKAAGEV